MFHNIVHFIVQHQFADVTERPGGAVAASSWRKLEVAGSPCRVCTNAPASVSLASLAMSKSTLASKGQGLIGASLWRGRNDTHQRASSRAANVGSRWRAKPGRHPGGGPSGQEGASPPLLPRAVCEHGWRRQWRATWSRAGL